MTSVEYRVLETLAFFEQFGRALGVEELQAYLWQMVADMPAVRREIAVLRSLKKVVVEKDFVALSPTTIDHTLRRQDLLQDRRQKALQIAEHIYQAPGVASVILMNSTALQTLKPHSDIDLLIITEPNMLYVARTVIVPKLKRMHLMKSHHHQAGLACLGYWLSADNLDVKQYQTEMHTASYWLASMVPLAGIVGYRAFIRANPWVHEHLPNWKAHTVAHLAEMTNNQLPITKQIAYAGINTILYPIHRARVLADPEFRNSTELVCTPHRLKLHSVDKRLGYGHKTKAILDLLLTR